MGGADHTIFAIELGFLGGLVLVNLMLMGFVREGKALLLALFIAAAAITLNLRAGVGGVVVGDLFLNDGTLAATYALMLTVILALLAGRGMMELGAENRTLDGMIIALIVLAVVNAVAASIPQFAPLSNEYGSMGVTVASFAILWAGSWIRSKQEVVGAGQMALGWFLLVLGVGISELAIATQAEEVWLRDSHRPMLPIAAVLFTIALAKRGLQRTQGLLQVMRSEYESRLRQMEIRMRKDLDEVATIKQERKKEQGIQGELREKMAERNEALKAAREAAEEAARAKSSFIAFLSHEIRTPLNGLMGTARLLVDQPLPGRQRSLVQALNSAGESLLALVNDVLDQSKLEAGQMEIEEIDIDLHKLLDSIVATMGSRAGEAGLELRLEVADTVPQAVKGDPNRLRQVFLNLVSNALKFTEQGSITVRAKALPGAAEDRQRIRFEVEDTGIGIKEEAKPRIFQAYGQADAATARLYGGTGLGLNICRQLVEAMGGKIGFDSSEGVGTTFFFHVDFRPGELAMDDGTATGAGAVDLPPLKVLLVEDDPVSQLVIEGYLQRHHHDVTIVSEGEAALDLLREDRFDVVLSDLNLTDMTGIELARWVREIADPALSQVPIIAVTGSTGADDRAACAAAGIAELVTKPVEPAALEAALARVLSVPVGTGRQAADTDKAAPAADVPRIDGRRISVLIVEDDRIAQEVVAAYLRDDGIICTIAPDAEAGLEILERQDFDALILDLFLPGISGIELVRELRSSIHPHLHSLPIIAITQYDTDAMRAEATQAGIAELLPKPVDPAYLRTALLRHRRETPARERVAVVADPADAAVARAKASARPPQATTAVDGFGNPIAPEPQDQDWEAHYLVLVIEDDPISQEIVGTYLTGSGHTPTICGTAEEGLLLFDSRPFDVVLMDVDLPGINGLEATRRIRAHARAEKSDTPVIAITGNISQRDIQACRDAGMNDFIGKPVDPGYLAGAIRRVVRLRRQAETEQDGGLDEDDITAIMDEGTVAHLRRAFDDAALDGLLGHFGNKCAEIAEALDLAADRRDAGILRAQSHLLKGMAANLGMAALRALAADIEDAALAEDYEAIPALVEQVPPMMEASRLAIDYLRANKAA